MTISFEGISLGFLFLRWNGLLIALGAGAGMWLAARELKRRELEAELVYYFLLPLSIWGFLFARLWHVFTPSISAVQLGLTTAYYLSNPLDILAVWIGGFGIPGVWLGGLLALFFFTRQNEISFWKFADALAPAFMLAQAIGRLGNYFNQELYGLPSNAAWKIFIAPEYRLSGFEQTEYYHPLFAYESLLGFACVFLLLSFARRLKFEGGVFLLYIIAYSVIRFALEFLRLDVSLLANGANINQIFFAGAFFLSAALLLWRARFAKL